MDFLANPLHLMLLVVVLVLLFGANKLGDVGGALGKSIREFKKEATTGDPPRPASTAPTAGYIPPAPPMASYTPPSVIETPPPGSYVPAPEPPRPVSYTPGDYRPSGAPTPPPAAPPDFSGR